jgi:hypothetical protein
MKYFVELSLTETNRISIRKKLIHQFLEEVPGSGKGDLRSEYYYQVETLQNGNRIFLKRPARLNKGFDFEVNVEGANFGKLRRSTMPSHSSIEDDLKGKLAKNAVEFKKLVNLIDALYRCEFVSDQAMLSLNFTTGYPAETIIKSIKWLFIEQDITYWNWSGRTMLYYGLSKLWNSL